MPSFHDIGIDEPFAKPLSDLRFSEPTSVQMRAIPEILAGRDVAVAAHTGSGKTAAFCLPLMKRYPAYESQRNTPHTKLSPITDERCDLAQPHIVIISPTRELASQTFDFVRFIERSTGHTSVCLLGGLSAESQIVALKRGCDIIVATPGRLLDLIEQGYADLRALKALVIDEADTLLDIGFIADIRAIMKHMPDTRQTLLFSATLEKSVMKHFIAYLKNPLYIEIDKANTTATSVRQYHLTCAHRDKQHLLERALRALKPKRVIVFTRTKRRADACAQRLKDSGFSAQALHGNKSQAERARILKEFSQGVFHILVTTDVLARGIDVENIDWVINFDVPHIATDYIHRIGRSGRAQTTGSALTFVSPETAEDFSAIEKLIGTKIPELSTKAWEMPSTPTHTKTRHKTPTPTPKHTTHAQGKTLKAKPSRGALHPSNDPELEQARREYEAKQARKRTRKHSPSSPISPHSHTAHPQTKKTQHTSKNQPAKRTHTRSHAPHARRSKSK